MQTKPWIHLHQRQLDEIREHGMKTYPEECCGFLYGTEIANERVIHEIVAIDNSRQDNKERRFLITPEDFLEAERRASDLNLNLIGFYHSHPDHPAIPSEFDREHALPFYSYVIISVRGRIPAEIRSYQLADDRESYIEEKLIIHQRIAI